MTTPAELFYRGHLLKAYSKLRPTGIDKNVGLKLHLALLLQDRPWLLELLESDAVYAGKSDARSRLLIAQANYLLRRFPSSHHQDGDGDDDGKSTFLLLAEQISAGWADRALEMLALEEGLDELSLASFHTTLALQKSKWALAQWHQFNAEKTILKGGEGGRRSYNQSLTWWNTGLGLFQKAVFNKQPVPVCCLEWMFKALAQNEALLTRWQVWLRLGQAAINCSIQEGDFIKAWYPELREKIAAFLSKNIESCTAKDSRDQWLLTANYCFRVALELLDLLHYPSFPPFTILDESMIYLTKEYGYIHTLLKVSTLELLLNRASRGDASSGGASGGARVGARGGVSRSAAATSGGGGGGGEDDLESLAKEVYRELDRLLERVKRLKQPDLCPTIKQTSEGIKIEFSPYSQSAPMMPEWSTPLFKDWINRHLLLPLEILETKIILILIKLNSWVILDNSTLKDCFTFLPLPPPAVPSTPSTPSLISNLTTPTCADCLFYKLAWERELPLERVYLFRAFIALLILKQMGGGKKAGEQKKWKQHFIKNFRDLSSFTTSDLIKRDLLEYLEKQAKLMI